VDPALDEMPDFRRICFVDVAGRIERRDVGGIIPLGVSLFFIPALQSDKFSFLSKDPSGILSESVTGSSGAAATYLNARHHLDCGPQHWVRMDAAVHAEATEKPENTAIDFHSFLFYPFIKSKIFLILSPTRCLRPTQYL